MIPFTWHLPSSGHSCLCLQLHPSCSFSLFWLFLCCIIFWLWPFIIAFIFLVQLYPILSVFLFKTLCRGCLLGKCLSMILRNSLPTFVVTWQLKGGVYQIISLGFLFLFFFLSSVPFSKCDVQSCEKATSRFWISNKKQHGFFRKQHKATLVVAKVTRCPFNWPVLTSAYNSFYPQYCVSSFNVYVPTYLTIFS